MEDKAGAPASCCASMCRSLPAVLSVPLASPPPRALMIAASDTASGSSSIRIVGLVIELLVDSAGGENIARRSTLSAAGAGLAVAVVGLVAARLSRSASAACTAGLLGGSAVAVLGLVPARLSRSASILGQAYAHARCGTSSADAHPRGDPRDPDASPALGGVPLRPASRGPYSCPPELSTPHPPDAPPDAHTVTACCLPCPSTVAVPASLLECLPWCALCYRCRYGGTRYMCTQLYSCVTYTVLGTALAAVGASAWFVARFE